MGFVDFFDEQEKEFKELYKKFSLEFAWLRTMVYNIETDRAFIIRYGRSDELPSTKDVVKAREEILENSDYLLVSKGDLKDQIEKAQKIPDKVKAREEDRPHLYLSGRLKDLEDIDQEDEKRSLLLNSIYGIKS
jgi:hypothetical protein